jgi:hypothetical protein
VTALVLSLALPLTTRIQRDGLRLSSGNLDMVDGLIARDDFRGVLASFVIPSMTVQQGIRLDPEDDDDFQGNANVISGRLVLLRGGFCGPMGGHGRATLMLINTGGRGRVQCSLSGRDPQNLALSDALARFEYSDDGRIWRSSWIVQHGQPVSMSSDPTRHLRLIYIRVSDRVGAPVLTARAQSLQPDSGTTLNAAPVP